MINAQKALLAQTLLIVTAIAAAVWATAHLADRWPVLLIAVGGICACLVARQAVNEASIAAKEASNRAELNRLEFKKHREVIDALADDLEVAIFLCAPSGIIEYANRKVSELFRSESPRGKTILAVTLSHDLEALVARAATTQSHNTVEVVFRYPEERIGIAHAWGDPNNSERVFLSIYEITSLRRLERIRRDFVANVSHEIRTPMTNIRAMSEILNEGDENDWRELGTKYTDRIIAEVDRLIAIANDLLTISTAESQPPDKQIADLSQIVRETCDELVDKARTKGLELTIDAPGPVSALVNTNQMKQIVLNLVDNAIKYTNSGSVRVALLVRDGRAELTVADTGIGIPIEHQSRVFERFYRVDKGRSRKSGGTGLGLSIVKHLVESHDGTVHLTSVMNEGTTVVVSLPLNA
jgi:two-component system phosphate regulon sensor histidine kinase PhoR